jgi:gliding motility-associated-like protein
MKSILFLIASIICFGSIKVSASHLAGADLSYKPVPGQPLTYTVRLSVYRDCNGVNLSFSTMDICYSSSSLGIANSITANFISLNVMNPGVCVTTSSACTGFNGDLEEYIFEGVVTLPQSAPDWIFSWENCCRSVAGNLTGTGAQTLFVSALLNNSTVSSNSSPDFHEILFTRFCVGSSYNYDQGAYEADGDSVVFKLVSAEGNGGACPPFPQNTQYVSPYSAIYPVSSSTPFIIDPLSGNINFTPNILQYGVICVLAEEYRNQVLIGSVKRDFMISVVGQCNPVLPSFNTTMSTLVAGCNDYQIVIPFDTSFQCSSAVPSDFRTLSSLGIPNPVTNVQPLNCQNGLTDSLLLTFYYPLTSGTTFLWIKQGVDGNTLLSECNLQMPPGADTLKIVVVDNAMFPISYDSVGCYFNSINIETSDSLFCYSVAMDGSDFLLTDSSGLNLPIVAASLFCNSAWKSNILNLSLNTQYPGVSKYYLTLSGNGSDGNTVANGCGRFLNSGDTIAVLTSGSFIPVNLGLDKSVCQGTALANLDIGYTGLTTQWYLNGVLIPLATDSFYSVSESGQYSVIVSDFFSCTGTDTVNIFVKPTPADSLGSDFLLCSTSLMPLLDAGNSGSIYQWYYNNSPLIGATNQQFQPQNSGSYQVEIYNGFCISRYEISISTTGANPIINLSDTIICTDGLATLDAGNPGFNFLWSTGDTTQMIFTNQPGLYLVSIDYYGCYASDSAYVQVQSYPSATVVQCQSEENDFFQYVYYWNAITGASFYEVSEDGGSSWIIANATAGPLSHGTDTTAVGILVRAIVPGLCETGASSLPIPCPLYLPNIITPNADGINDHFNISWIKSFPYSSLSVYNRFGKEVFTASPYNNDSEKFDGKDLPDGVYFYVLNLGDGQQEPKSGTVTINR